MKVESIIEKVKKFVEEECRKPTSKYCFEPFNCHFEPVVKYCLLLGEKKKADLEILEISAWLHDIGSIIFGREDHHITSSEIAEKKLRELNYPEDRIIQVRHCIFSHRRSKDIKRETTEAEILAEADSLANFDNIAGIFKAAFIFEKMNQIDAKISVKQKLINCYKKLSEEAKEIIKPKFDAVLTLF